MHTITFSLSDRPTIFDAAEEAANLYHKMSTTQKHRLEMLALILGLILTVASAVKVFVFLPPRVDALEKCQEKIETEIKVIQGKASATDVAIAGIQPQLAAITAGIAEIKADIRQLRERKE